MSDYASNSIYQAYKIVADKINWKEININDLFKLQIEHENDDLGEIYFAALVCRTFGYAGRIYSQCQRHVPFEECHDCIIDALKYVLAEDGQIWRQICRSTEKMKKGISVPSDLPLEKYEFC